MELAAGYLENRIKFEKTLSPEGAHTLAYSDYKQRHEIDREDDGLVLDWLYTNLKESGKLDQFPTSDNLFKYMKVK